MSKIYKGIDISSYQKSIYWSKAAKNIDFVMIRSGYGNNISQIDNMFKSHINGAIKAGIKHIGIYHFSYARNIEEAKKEANVCLEIIKPYKKYINLPVAFDWEYDSYDYCVRNGIKPTKSLCNNMAKEFLEVVKNQGYTPMLYTNPDYGNRFFNLKDYENLWIAQYANKCDIENVDIWQYTGSGKIDGIAGDVDLNYCYNQKYFESEDTYMSFKKSDNNDGVFAVKEQLIALYEMGAISQKVDENGVFGEGTEKAIKQVQKLSELSETGIADTKTVRAIGQLLRKRINNAGKLLKR